VGIRECKWLCASYCGY